MVEDMDARAMLARLVAFPTVTRDGNIALIEFVRDWLARCGVAAEIDPKPCGTRANLFAQIGPAEPGGVILSGHTDVVPVDGQDWASDPFTLTQRGDRLYGRGTADMKGFAALALALVPEMLRAGLKRPIQLALSCDEEIGCRGAPSMIARMRAELPPAAAVLVGEPTSMTVVTQHKASCSLNTLVRGAAVHSSQMHRGVSAVMAAARLVQWHADRTAEARAAATADSPFDPAWTTCHIGMIEGGTARNITAAECRFVSDFRVMPGEDPRDWFARYRAFCAEVEAELRVVRPEAAIEVADDWIVPWCAEEPGGAAEALARRLTGDNARRAVAYGTEAGQFQEAGYSACVVGPGSIDEAHQPDEYIEAAQLAEGEAFLRRVVAELAA